MREPGRLAAVAPVHTDYLVLPGDTNAIRFRLYTNAAPEASRLFNTFEIEAYGESLLESSGGGRWRRDLTASPANAFLHNILVNGTGPQLSPSNGMTVIEQASGPDWQCVVLDASAAYRHQLRQFTRGILFVEPDLFILHDRLIAGEPAMFQMLLHAPAATQVDRVWGDLRLEQPGAGFRISTPAAPGKPRHWERIDSAVDKILPDTVTLRIGPTNRLAQLDLLTVFAIHRGGEKRDYAFKLLESDSAVGARIHRDGLPTLVAFKTAAGSKASLAGFEFNGPAGVSVYQPKNAR